MLLSNVNFSCFQEWPEEDYPPYANGPGYVLSSDIAHFVLSEFEKHTLRVSLYPFYTSFLGVLHLNKIT